MFQVTCIHDRQPPQVHLGPVAVQLKLRITLGTPHMVITLTPVILSVRIKEEKATKVGMPPAPLNPSKALISKSGPPHDHFNWPVMERCAEWLGLARGLFLITYSKSYRNIQCAYWSWESVLDFWDILWMYLYIYYIIYMMITENRKLYFQYTGYSIISNKFLYTVWYYFFYRIYCQLYNYVVDRIVVSGFDLFGTSICIGCLRNVRAKNVSIEPVMSFTGGRIHLSFCCFFFNNLDVTWQFLTYLVWHLSRNRNELHLFEHVEWKRKGKEGFTFLETLISLIARVNDTWSCRVPKVK